MSYSRASSSESNRSRNKNMGVSVDISNYRLITSSYPVEWEYEGVPIFCYCNLKAPRWCSWTNQNPRRRFYGCHHYPANDCGFHAWHDPIVPERTKEIIMELRNRKRMLYDNVKMLKTEAAQLRSNGMEMLEAELIEENLCLRNEVVALNVKLKEISEAMIPSNSAGGFKCKCVGFKLILNY